MTGVVETEDDQWREHWAALSGGDGIYGIYGAGGVQASKAVG